jgi:protein-L-isoaspartate(D-aspartate) O-methyltransferase
MALLDMHYNGRKSMNINREFHMALIKNTIQAAFLLFVIASCNVVNQQEFTQDSSGPYESARKKMVEQQIQARGVDDPTLLSAFLRVERHRFVPKDHEHLAYIDRPLPIGEGQTISQPYIVAFMTEVLNLSRTDRVLEIGTGSGYQAAILGEISDYVYTIEINEVLGRRAEVLLKDLGYANVHVRVGDGYKGWPEQAPFDAIIVTCAPTHVPVPLKEQLREGGRMIIPVGEAYDQKLVYIEKIKGELKQQDVLPVMFVPMIDRKGESY